MAARPDASSHRRRQDNAQLIPIEGMSSSGRAAQACRGGLRRAPDRACRKAHGSGR
ncbi:hypothetical protein SLG_34930 [Sphingobium sp. SYK-6]|nr:hypothetical protein SLG_34930 [Sphingobium sp. SYK-6]